MLTEIEALQLKHLTLLRELQRRDVKVTYNTDSSWTIDGLDSRPPMLTHDTLVRNTPSLLIMPWGTWVDGQLVTAGAGYEGKLPELTNRLRDAIVKAPAKA